MSLNHASDPVHGAPGRDLKEDSEYVRGGTCSILVWVEPPAGHRRINARRQRARPDRAEEVDQLLTGHHHDAEQAVLGMENPNYRTMDEQWREFDWPPRIKMVMVKSLRYKLSMQVSQEFKQSEGMEV
ncbi:hypothetical protein MTQ01_22125 [Streptomyces sp. XM4193]|uniref:hypothetical protein n=1 Tax=Streptomyces sp. XM4193 TaxID=2929782 RepID=UPI001FF99938|nr:hypothetical protein [Streptomyces sp. XM4193]MCK1798672.1 hypothetical protein [Streptomyces sp. XM4193]